MTERVQVGSAPRRVTVQSLFIHQRRLGQDLAQVARRSLPSSRHRCMTSRHTLHTGLASATVRDQKRALHLAGFSFICVSQEDVCGDDVSTEARQRYVTLAVHRSMLSHPCEPTFHRIPTYTVHGNFNIIYTQDHKNVTFYF